MNRHSAILREALKEYRNEKWDNKIRSLNTQNQSAWQMQKALRREMLVIPPLHGQQGIAYEDQDKAEAFADTLETEGRLNTHPDEDDQHEAEVMHTINDLDAQNPSNQTPMVITPRDTRTIVRRLKKRKAPGKDGITNKMLKEMPRKGMVALTNIINAIVRREYFPLCWKHAEVIMLNKPGKSLKFPQNYRPISLLPALSKVAERAIKMILDQEMAELNLIPSEQFGFRSGHSTELQALRLVETITSGFNNREVTGAVFLDIERAFDRVWHEGLIRKMIDAGLSNKICKVIRSYLKDRSFCVKVKEHKSSTRQINTGVPQGSVLGPHLYSIYVHDTPKVPGNTLALHADDTAIMAKHRRTEVICRRLQDHADLLRDWCITWKLKCNAQKSQAILFQKRRQIPPREIRIDDTAVPWVQSVKYLGFILDKRLTWREHTTALRNKTRQAMSRLYPLIGRRSVMTLTKLRLIQAVARPQLTWGYAAKIHIKRLQATENKLIRAAANAPWFVRNAHLQQDLQWEPFKDNIRRRAEGTFRRAGNHPNEELRNLVAYDP